VVVALAPFCDAKFNAQADTPAKRGYSYSICPQDGKYATEVAIFLNQQLEKGTKIV
jgi:hypothetical protein